MCCNVLRWVAACCSGLQRVAICCTLPRSIMIRLPVCCSASQRVAACRSVLQRVVMCCNVLQCVSTVCTLPCLTMIHCPCPLEVPTHWNLGCQMYWQARCLFPKLIAGTLPPRGGLVFCSFPTKNPEEEDPPRSAWYKFFRGGPLPPGSWLGNLPNRKPTQGGGFPAIKIWWVDHLANFPLLVGGGLFLRKSTLKWSVERPRGGHKGGIPRSRNRVLAGATWYWRVWIAPPRAQLRERGVPPLRPPRGRSPHHLSVDFLKKRLSPSPNRKFTLIPSQNFGKGIRNAKANKNDTLKQNKKHWYTPHFRFQMY